MIRFVVGAWALAFAFLSSATAQTTYTEAGGVIVIEAENYSNSVAGSGAAAGIQWVTTNSVPGYSGAGYVVALPNNGVTFSNANWLGTAPQLQYTINFNTNLTHYVWVRTYAPAASNNLVNSGLPAQGAPTSTNTGSAIVALPSQIGAWAWTSNRFTSTFPRPRVVVSTVGPQTFSLWMGETGMNIDEILLTTNINFQAIVGNVFHIPTDVEAGNSGLTMRSPVTGMTSNTAVFLYTGNQFQGSGNPGNQLATGSTIYYRNATNSTWSSLPMGFWYQGGASGNNKYYSNSIPAFTFNAGDTVQYYFKIPYSDHLPTYVYGNNNASQTGELQSDAQSSPFSYTIATPLQPPSGGYVSYSNVVGSTIYEVEVFTNSGGVTLVGPDIEGNPLTNAVSFLAPSAVVGGNSITGGPVTATSLLTNGVQLTETFGSTSIIAQITFPYPGVMHYEVVNWGAQVLTSTAITVPSSSSEHFFGFGEKFNALDQAGNKVHIMTYDTSARSVADDTYAVSPWFMSSQGYGFDLDSTDESWFDMRNQYPDRYVISNMVGSTFSGYVTNAVKFNIVYGPNLTDVLTRYTAYKGRPLLPPPWAFLPWMSSDVWSSGGEVRYVLSQLRAYGIPGSILVYDSPWEYSYNDFTWNTSQFSPSGTFPNINGGGSSNYQGFATINNMMSFLQNNGYKAICWFTPFINTSSDSPECYENCYYDVCLNENFGTASNYPAALASNLFVNEVSSGATNVLSVSWWKGTGSPLDFTNPNAVQYLQSTLSNLVAQSGGVIGGFKTDDGEAQASPTPFIPLNAQYADGRTGVEMQNGFCVEYQKTVSGVLGTNGIDWGRSGFAGSQAYPGIWGGDNQPNFGDSDGLPGVMVAGESIAMTGYSIWGSDICGYEDSPWSSSTNNLFMRWTQFGAFCPIMQMHRSTSLCLMYPWSFGADALTNYIYYAQLHAALFPYIYSYATQSSTNGLPIIRPLVLMYQSDTNTYGSVYNTEHSYLFGNEFLVAPVVTNPPASGPTIRSVYLPQGNWYDYFANVRYSGGQTIIWTNANQHQMPLFVREGAVIPMISTNVQTLLDTSYTSNPNLILPGNALQFLIYPTTNSSFTVYDGTSLNCQSNGTVVTASLSSNPRPVSMRFFVSQPFGVEYDGVRMPQFTNATAYAGASIGWYYDSGGFLNVQFSHTGGTGLITFGPDSVGDGISDSWRQDHFGSATTTNASSCATCDPDGDGFDNLDEYLAGTDPLNSANYLHVNSVTPSDGGIGLAFNSVLGMNYEVDYTPNLVNDPWQVLTNGVSGTGGIIPINDPGAAGQTQRFYRVTLLP
jgi:alpha-D-xyloside xylohydrolase